MIAYFVVSMVVNNCISSLAQLHLTTLHLYIHTLQKPHNIPIEKPWFVLFYKNYLEKGE